MAWSAPNSTSASGGWPVPREQVGDRPVPEFESEATNGEMGPREAVAAPGIAAVDIGCADRAIDRKKARPPEASGIPRTYTEQVIRAAPGTLRDPPPGVGVGEGTGRKAKLKAGCPGAAKSPARGGPGAVKGKGRGGRSRPGPRLWAWPRRCGRGPAR